MAAPRYTVVLPMARFHADEPVLASLRATPPPEGPAQVIVAEGNHPARQRNAVLKAARGDVVVFLDNDCTLDADYWRELEKSFSRAEVEAVGGPALLRPNATTWERIFHALLTHTLIVGTVSSRYAPRGEFRVATQTDLILCNFAARRSAFEKIGPLSTRLYPNEENEWLDRAQAQGVKAWYDPALRVYRPQRASPGAMALTLLRYGMGRTRQFQVSGWQPTFHQFLPLMVLATFAAIIVGHLEIAFIALWLLASVIIAVSCDSGLNFGQKIVAGLVAPAIPLTYALGQMVGWVALVLPRRATSLDVTLRDENGNPLP